MTATIPRLRILALAFVVGAAVLRASAAGSVYDVTSFGAKGDGTVLDTPAIQQAIEAAAGHGGGTVYFPTGRFLSGTITLKSAVTLELSPGAVLLGSPKFADYQVKHLIYAQGVTNVAIIGSGVIDGNGDAYFDEKMNPAAQRPSPLIELWDSRGIRVEGVTIRNAPAWTLHPKNCEDVKIRGISLLNNLRAVNSDGIDIDSSRNVIVSDCHIEAGDDCIVLKTTRRGEGEVQPTENVVVTNCVLVSAATALKLGTESHADFRHILFSNCTIRNSRTGIGLLAKDGGVMEDVRFSNIVMTTAPKWGQGLEWPIVVDVEKRTEASRLSRIRDVAFSDITIQGRGRVIASGTPDSPIENLSFRNVTLRFTGYEEIKAAKKMRGGSHTVAANMPDYSAQPAAMIFAHVRGLSVDGVRTVWPQVENAPSRAVVYGDQLQDVAITGLRGGASVPGTKPVLLENTKDVAP